MAASTDLVVGEEEFDSSSDYDSDLEYSLYAKIHHRTLDFDDCNSFGYDSENKNLEKIGSSENFDCKNFYSDTTGYLEKTEISSSTVYVQNKCKAKKFKTSILCEIEDSSVTEIQKTLSSDKYEWKICQRDLKGAYSGARYYEEKRSGLQCRRCQNFGHKARECKEKIKQRCFSCGSTTHRTRRCPERACMLCFSREHYSFTCPVGVRKIWSRTCERCGFSGHNKLNCPERWRQFHSATSTSTTTQLKKTGLYNFEKQGPKAMYCYNCGYSGHLGHECGKSTNYNGHLVCFPPAVRHYDSGQQLTRILFPEQREKTQKVKEAQPHSQPRKQKEKKRRWSRKQEVEVEIQEEDDSIGSRIRQRRIDKLMDMGDIDERTTPPHLPRKRKAETSNDIDDLQDDSETFRKRKKNNGQFSSPKQDAYLPPSTPTRATARKNFDRLMESHNLLNRLKKTLKEKRRAGANKNNVTETISKTPRKSKQMSQNSHALTMEKHETDIRQPSFENAFEKIKNKCEKNVDDNIDFAKPVFSWDRPDGDIKNGWSEMDIGE